MAVVSPRIIPQRGPIPWMGPLQDLPWIYHGFTMDLPLYLRIIDVKHTKPPFLLDAIVKWRRSYSKMNLLDVSTSTKHLHL